MYNTPAITENIEETDEYKLKTVTTKNKAKDNNFHTARKNTYPLLTVLSSTHLSRIQDFSLKNQNER